MADQNAAIDPDLPDDIQQEAQDNAVDREEKLNGLSLVIARKREEAVTGRRNSGIEEIWSEDEDAYEGIDDANRDQVKIMKPQTIQGGLTTTRKPAYGTRATMFLPITTQYVDNSASRVGDMLLPTDDRAFELKPEPVPELTGLKGDTTPMLDATGEPMLRAPQDGETPAATGPNGPVVPVTKGDKAQEELDLAADSAKKAETRIDDWLVQCQFHAEKRHAIHDRAKVGVGIMKGPFPVIRKARAVSRKPGGAAVVEMQEQIMPASRRIDYWNLFPDPACGENIHNGNFLLERDFLTEKQLRALDGVPDYLSEQIQLCLEEGPQKAFANGKRPDDNGKNATKQLYEIWYYYGEIKKDDLLACGCNVAEDQETKPAIVTLVNDRVIKAVLNPLDSGDFPYDATPWQLRSGHWAGIGVARQVRQAQSGVNASVRAMLDNGALSSGPILGIDRTKIEPADGSWALTPRKIFYTRENEEGGDMREALFAFDIPSKQPDLMAQIEFFLKMAEQTTGMPMLMQGQTGGAPDTLGGQLLATNNAGTALRRIAKLDDDYCTEPHIERYYQYLMSYGDDDDEKGNFTVDARGSSALVERDIQNHAIIQMLEIGLKNPAFEMDPKKAYAEACKAQKLDPKRLQYSEEDQAKRAQQPPPPPIPIAVAQINANAEIEVEKMKITHDVGVQSANNATAQGQGSAPDTSVQVANIRQETELKKAQMTGEQELQALAMKRDMMILQFAQDNKIQVAEVKAELGKAAMTLTVQERLADKSTATELFKHHKPAAVAPEVATPLAEPPGRAEPGQAFTQ